MMKTRKLLLAGATYLMASNLHAATYFVDNTVPNCAQNGNLTPCCSDSHTTNQNSINRPWCTVTKANSTHAAGDTVNFKGEFREELIPKAGLNDSQRTVYTGYGNDKTAATILGSDEISANAWTRCIAGAGCPAGVNSNVYRTSFNAPKQCRIIEGIVPGCTIDGNRSLCYIDNTNCWLDRTTWLLRADPNKPIETISDLNAPGEFFYDHGDLFHDADNHYLYIWLPDSSNPAAHKIECAQRPFLAAGGYTDPPVPQVDNFTLQYLTLLQSHGRGITFNPSPHRPGNITIQNLDLGYTTGGSYCAGNPAAIYHGNSNDRTPDIPNIKILNNRIFEAASESGSVHDPRIGTTTHRGTAIEFYTVKDSVIEGNEIFNTFEGIDMKQGDVNMLIKDNNIHTVGMGIWIGAPSGGNSPNAPLFNGVSATIVGNLIHNLDNEGSQRAMWTTDGNTRVNMYNNTLVRMSGVAITTNNLSDTEYRKDNVHIDLKNNIFYELSSKYGLNDLGYLSFAWNSLATSTSDYNLYFSAINPAAYFARSWLVGAPYSASVTYPTLENWQTVTGQDSHSSISNPQFVNSSAFNFGLQSSSPARNTGARIPGLHCGTCGLIAPDCRTWYGSNPDRGALEFVEACSGDSSPPAPPGDIQVF